MHPVYAKVRAAIAANSNHGDWISAADTAALVRTFLKANYPGLKFSVRSETFSGGSAVNVSSKAEVDSKQVNRELQRFIFRDFDGMIDMQSSVSHWLLPTGELHLAKRRGTETSGGVIPAQENDAPSADAVMVSGGASFVNFYRD